MLAVSIAEVRDYVIVIFAGTGVFVLLLILIMAFLIFRKVGPLLGTARTNLEHTKTTLGNIASTASLVSEAVIRPTVKGVSFLAGLRQGAAFFIRFYGRKVGNKDE